VHATLTSAKRRTPNPDPPGSLRHVSPSDRRPRSIRGIATRDFSRCRTLTSSNPRMPKPRSPMDFDSLSPVVGVISRATPPQSDGPRDFAELHGDLQPSILFLLKRFPLHHLRSVWPLLGSISAVNKRTISPELSPSLIPPEVLSNTLPVLGLQIPPEVLKPSGPCAFTLATARPLPSQTCY
jgi:hypothetical protein